MRLEMRGQPPTIGIRRQGFFFFKQKTAYEVETDWSSDVCSSDLDPLRRGTWGGADRAIDLSALGRGECHQGTVAQASHQLHAGLRPRGIGRATAGGKPGAQGT